MNSSRKRWERVKFISLNEIATDLFMLKNPLLSALTCNVTKTSLEFYVL